MNVCSVMPKDICCLPSRQLPPSGSTGNNYLRKNQSYTEYDRPGAHFSKVPVTLILTANTVNIKTLFSGSKSYQDFQETGPRSPFWSEKPANLLGVHHKLWTVQIPASKI